MRKTPERFAILDRIIDIKGHFTIESLMLEMENSKFIVSRATLYNTIDLLLEAQLIRRHSIDGMPTQYELANTPPHTHLICTVCGKLKEVRDNNFIMFMNTRKYTAFTSRYFSLYVYGTCSTCARKRKRKQLNKKR